jgi:Glycosyltransferase family 87
VHDQQRNPHSKMSGNFSLFLLVLALFSVVSFSKPAIHSVDFLVYYHAARVLVNGHGALYGPQSGIGWPQIFRYPPLFLVAFLPFALLPVKPALFVWLAVKCATLFFVVRELTLRIEFPRTGWWWLIPVCLCGGFIVQEFRFGNAQFLIFALVAAALWNLRQRPVFSAFLLAFAVSLKVWPLFFLPYVAARRHMRVAVLTACFVVGLTLLPAVHFGWQGNVALLRQWAAQEWGTGSLGQQAWFPSQSLGGVQQRYLTAMDFSNWPDPNYPHVNFVALDPRIVRSAWIALTVIGYGSLLLLARATPGHLDLLTDALSFCMLPLLQPFAYRPEMVVLLWPAMTAGALLARWGALPKWPRFLLCAAVLVEALEPLIPGGQSQRFFQAAGVDCWATCLLAAGLLAVWLQSRRVRDLAQTSSHSLEISASVTAGSAE